MVPNSGSQSDRFSGALLERNLRIAGTGQEMWAHACNLCRKDTDDGRKTHVYMPLLMVSAQHVIQGSLMLLSWMVLLSVIHAALSLIA